MKRVQLIDRWTLIWATSVAAVSLMPWRFKVLLGTAGMFHSWAHLLVFAITAMLVCRKNAALPSQVLRTVAALLFAVAIEYLQHVLYGNAFEWHDVIVDTAGILIGLAFALLFAWIRPIRVSGTPAPR